MKGCEECLEEKEATVRNRAKEEKNERDTSSLA